MKIFLQRSYGATKIESKWADKTETFSFDGVGLVCLLGWTQIDEKRSLAELEEAERWLLKKVMGIRIFPDDKERMNLSLVDYLEMHKKTGGILWVPQFTLAASLDSGFRPSFTHAMKPDLAAERFRRWKDHSHETSNIRIRQLYGVFGADMLLSFQNWGPVSIMLER
ncbi:MAG TPA: D-aminoacyl-tRNA deacylase [Bdellovibrionota bacterium]|jgi:D-tyrosyl-tRNA(Tyr) deacylase|nr:D-aminoacyl-tRNA deacylase [Bdellovibrionota bacterium]